MNRYHHVIKRILLPAPGDTSTNDTKIASLDIFK